jgi:hypothetical protein
MKNQTEMTFRPLSDYLKVLAMILSVFFLANCAYQYGKIDGNENKKIIVPDVTGLYAISGNLLWNDPSAEFDHIEITAGSTGDITKVDKGIQTVDLTIKSGEKETFTVRAVDSSDNVSGGVSVTGYTVGATGPAGGMIFYINKNAAADGWTYLEAASCDQTNSTGIIWGGCTYLKTNIVAIRTHAEGTAIGTGKSNTETILSVLTSATASDCPAKACKDYSTTNNGIVYKDWFLPSKDEIAEMYSAIGNNGTFNQGCGYWSSSEIYINDKENHAWYQAFDTITHRLTYTWKCYQHGARACRRF